MIPLASRDNHSDYIYRYIKRAFEKIMATSGGSTRRTPVTPRRHPAIATHNDPFPKQEFMKTRREACE